MQGQVNLQLFRKLADAGIPFGVKESLFGNGATSNSLGRGASGLWWAQKFVAVNSSTITQGATWMLRVANPTFNVRMKIYSHNAGADTPDAQIGTESGSVLASTFTLTPTKTKVDWLGMNVPLVLGQIYWVVLVASGFNSSNYSGFRASTDVLVDNRMGQSSDGLSWVISTGTSMDFELAG